jgi:hypothetical protein
LFRNFPPIRRKTCKAEQLICLNEKPQPLKKLQRSYPRQQWTAENVFCRLSRINAMPPPAIAFDMAVEEGEKGKEMDASELSSTSRKSLRNKNHEN